MSDHSLRTVSLSRLEKGRALSTNRHGVTLELGDDGTTSFSPVELLLAAIAGCSGIDVDYITSKRAEPEALDLRISADKVRDDSGNHLTDITLSFDIRFPEEAGDAARAVVPRAVAQSHDRLCTVSHPSGSARRSPRTSWAATARTTRRQAQPPAEARARRPGRPSCRRPRRPRPRAPRRW